MVHPLAGKKVREQDIINAHQLEHAFYDIKPDYNNIDQRVSFGTSGHRGVASKGTFNEDHIAAIVQAICDVREQFGASGPCFIGQDTHALSQHAMRVALEVLLGNGITVYVDEHRDFVPTPSVSRAILRYNQDRTENLADGIVITPSHNPPEHGGLKYDPTNGGPAEKNITSAIADKANEYLKEHLAGVKRLSFTAIIDGEEGPAAKLLKPYPFKHLYVEELANIIDMKALKNLKAPILINALGGSGASYWHLIKETYDLPLTIINDKYDPTFQFMTYDSDGVVRMDCSSPYAMAEVVENLGDYVLAVGNDPDYDRYGIVTKRGLLPANKFLTAAGIYLFGHRHWSAKGFGKTAVVTDIVDRYAAATGKTVYEVPVGFKYFSSLLFDGIIGIGGEESAGASFLQQDGSVWTTDKDGILMGLLAMEILAVTGKTPDDYYEEVTETYGKPVFKRLDMPCEKAVKVALKAMTADQITVDTLGGSKIVSVATTSPYGDFAIDGVKIRTETGWIVARPSGTEDLYKIYAESYTGEAALEALITEGKALIDSLVKA